MDFFFFGGGHLHHLLRRALVPLTATSCNNKKIPPQVQFQSSFSISANAVVKSTSACILQLFNQHRRATRQIAEVDRIVLYKLQGSGLMDLEARLELAYKLERFCFLVFMTQPVAV